MLRQTSCTARPDDVAPPIGQHGKPTIDPFARPGAGNVRLVLDVGLDDLDRAPKQGATEILDGEFDGGLRAKAADSPVWPRNVTQQPNAHRG